MKVSKVIELCKRNHVLCLYDDPEGVQWISDGCALYPLWGLPTFDDSSIKASYDISDKLWEKMQFHRQYGVPKGYDLADLPGEERRAERMPLWIRYAGVSAVPYIVSTGVAWMDSAYLTPFGTEERLEVWERRTEDGRLYFAVKIGLELSAVVMPCLLPQEELAQHLEFLSGLCRRSLQGESGGEGEQMTMEEAVT